MKTLTTFLLLFIFSFTSAQNNLFPVFKGGKWGVMNENSKIIIPFNYNHIYIENDFCIAKKKNKYGILNNDGTIHLELKYDKIKFLSKQFALLYKKSLVSVYNFNNNKISEFTKEKNIRALEPATYSIKFNDSLSIINVLENKTFTFSADTISSLKANTSSSSSMMDFISAQTGYYYIGKNGKLGILASTFDEITSIQYDDIQLVEGHFVVLKNNKKGIIDFLGNELIPCKYTKISNKNSDYLVENKGKFGLYNSAYQEIMECIYNNIYFSSYTIITFRKGSFFGACNANGQILIPAGRYTYLKAISSGHLFYTQNRNSGIITASGQNINNQNISDAYMLNDLGFAIRKNNKYGFISFTGKKIIPIEFERISYLNKKHILVKNKNKCGVVNTMGKGVIPLKYKDIYSTSHPDIFDVKTFWNDSLSGIDIQYLIKTKIPGGTNDFIRKEYKWGVINSHGEILLDTIYFRQQLRYDFLRYAIKVKKDTSVLIVSFDDDGSLIDKISYKNYVNFKITTYVKGYFWRVNPSDKDSNWGLISKRGRNMTGYSFLQIQRRYRNNPNLVLTINRNKNSALNNKIEIGRKSISVSSVKQIFRYGIVNQLNGKEELSCYYITINQADFKYASVARCLSSKARFQLINNEGKRVGKRYAYIDDFQSDYTRINSGGELKISRGETYNVFLPGYKSEGMKALDILGNYNLECIGGKWGLIDTNGIVVMRTKYEFLQKYHKNEFIAKKKGKWGVIFPGDSIKIAFKFDEIRYFKDQSETGKWSDENFYKIKKGKFWGVADSLGQIIIKPTYNDIEILNNSKGIFFAVKEKKLWGVVTINEAEIVPVDFSEVSYLSKEHKLFFRTANKQKFTDYIDKEGKAVSHYRFSDARDFKNDFAQVSFGKKQWNFINKKFDVISNINFIETHDFYNKRAAVKVGKKWGFVNEDGDSITAFHFSKVSDFSENKAMVEVIFPPKLFGLIKQKRKQGYINLNGEICIKPKYKKAFDFNHGVAIVANKKRKTGLISADGNEVLKMKYRSISEFSKQGLAVVSNFKRESAVVDSLGSFIVPFGKYTQINEYKNGFSLVKLKNLYGFIDQKGNEIFKPQFKGASDFSENLAAVKIGRRWGYIDKDTIKIDEIYRKAGDFENKHAFVNNEKYQKYYIDENGIQISGKPTILSEGFYKKQNLNGKIVFYDKFNRDVFNAVFSKAENFKDGLSVVMQKGKYALLNNKGYFIIPPILDKINNFSENYAVYKSKTQYGLYNSEGKEILKTNFFDIKSSGNSLIKITDLNRIFYIESETEEN